MGTTVSDSLLAASIELMEFCASEILTHRDEIYPHEAVGILTADGATYPLINQARSSKRFEVNESQVKEAIDVLNDVGKTPVAIYHSHPESASGPSQRDISLMQRMPGALSVIIGQDGIAGWLWDDQLHSVGKIPLPERNRNDDGRTS